MKKKTLLLLVLPIGLLLTFLWNCNIEAIKVAPTVTLAPVSDITSNSATSGGDVASDGGATVNARGVCWGSNQNPTISDSKTSNGIGTGSFTSSITGLIPGTAYYLRAFATNSVETAYSSQAIFTTLAIAPVITTTALSAITTTTATGGGDIITEGGSPVTARGVCWAATPNPTMADSKTSDWSELGSFTSDLTGLLPCSTFYVRAYATNSIGTTYGNQVTFTTAAVSTVVTTTAVSAITATSVTSGGNISGNGGFSVTARGVCWATTQNPTTASSKTTNGTGTGTFSSNLTGLTGTTTYYIRAYSISGNCTSYGGQETFTTPGVPPVVTTSDISALTSSTATCGGNITNDGGSAITERGVCWTTDNYLDPTTTNSKTTDGTGAGTFTSNITGLADNTLYYIRAYATSSLTTSYGKRVSFRTLCSNNALDFNPNLTYGTVTDIDGNVYKTIKIGTQTWMAENLKTTRYRNGDPLTNITDNTSWWHYSKGNYCWYNNDPAHYKETYGALYKWYAITDNRNIAPIGWHVPTDEEWTTLTTYLGGDSVAAGKMKAECTNHWLSPNTGGTNSSGFTALPGGIRMDFGEFNSLGLRCHWWSSTSDVVYGDQARCLIIVYINARVGRASDSMSCGFSVRCVKD